MASIFTRIINREIPGYICAEDSKFIAILDINPIAMGHTLVIPKDETDYIFDLDDDTLSGFHLFSKKVAKALESTVECSRIGTAVIGLEVPHAHIHLVPINSIDDLDFGKPKLKFSNEEMTVLSERIKAQFTLLG